MSRIQSTLNIFLTVCLFLFLRGTGIAQTNCELRKDKENIRIYSCKSRDSDFNAIRAEFEVNSTIEKYISIVLDINGYKNWRKREINHKLLKKLSDTELIYYTQVVAPFPLSDRDMIMHLKLDRDPATKILTVTMEGLPDYIPKIDNIVRIPRSNTKMTLTPIDETKFKVDYFLLVDPGGNIPAWVINSFGVQAPHETFKNLKNKLEAN